MENKKIFLVRHSYGETRYFDQKLNKLGRDCAVNLGKQIRLQLLTGSTCVYVSCAPRAVETGQFIIDELGMDAKVEIINKLWKHDVTVQLIDTIKRWLDGVDVDNIILVSHKDTVIQFVHYLRHLGYTIDPDSTLDELKLPKDDFSDMPHKTSWHKPATGSVIYQKHISRISWDYPISYQGL